MTNKNKKQGFSLIELMIAVAILGIISAIAMPSYSRYVQKAKRTEAKAEVLRIAQLQENYYVQNLSYASQLDGAGGLGFSTTKIETETGLYTVETWPLTNAGAKDTDCDGTNADPCVAYVVEAVPATGSPQSHDSSCSGGFRISNTGLKQAKSSTDTEWSQATGLECW